MRWIIMAVAVLGALLAGGMGAKWLEDADNNAEAIRQLQEYQKGLPASGAVSQEFDQKMSRLNNVIRSAYLLVAGCLAALGVTVALGLNKVKPLVAGITWIACAVAPAVFEPKSLVFSFLLIVAGGLIILRKPATVAPV